MPNIDYVAEETTKAKEVATEVAKSSGGMDMMEILIIVIIVVSVLTLILSIIALAKTCGIKKKVDAMSIRVGNIDAGKGSDIGVVFCKKCGSNYSVSEKKCPYCGEKR